ncbi:hypothetical protein BU25DRAFT_26924 [Macroventuria anomochaeta]|uniref:Uncharacterized protein n=1 Tax=Macroventuria anomochaeta TaxID=301207 RepID=A0ACB6S7J6_9PLEO|nr:uncharacterized protein BU25DRAFT_26924 [Macroventuria anomochaeta]KAF2629107.1 hypothetical protein BU25DRAFT_26924 [Macroventuria anomochaeta]
MRAPSHIDFRTAVKMSQQAAIISGISKLTPLPTYQPQIVDDCYSYTPSPEPDLRFTPEIEQDGFPFSRGATPQTPAEPFGYSDPLPLVENMDYLDCQPWSSDGLVPVGLGFADMEMLLPDDNWMTPEPEEMAQANMFAQNVEMQGTFDALLGTMPEDWSNFQIPPQDDVVPDAKAVDSALDSGIVMQGEWTQHSKQNMYVDTANMITSTPYIPKMQAIPGSAPVWEDVFMLSPIPY